MAENSIPNQTQQKGSYDYSISVLRIISMVFIVLCHICSHTGRIALSQFLNVGVPIFFLLSGYLYGGKTITNGKVWISKRLFRLYLPLLAWIAVVTVAALLKRSALPTWYQYLTLFLNLQGIRFILTMLPKVFAGPWFFTSIMFCYLAVLGYQYLEKKHPKLDRLFRFGGIAPLAVFIVLACFRISTDGLLIFFVGYQLRQRGYLEDKKNVSRMIVSGVAAFVLSVLIRIGCRRLIDGTLLYDEIIVPLTHIGIASSALVAIKAFALIWPSVLEGIGKNRLTRYLDRISIYVYICHDWFIKDIILAVFDLSAPIWLIVPVFIILVLVTASVLYFIFERVIGRRLNRMISSKSFRPADIGRKEF